ncbi:MAG TPA: SGNH/GDSL hydrolase family protein [Steroidobacteraceae bacterium]|nr:SGNH/GDSL hydrolase family protein [Steroidobacteraceae bacterium]
MNSRPRSLAKEWAIRAGLVLASLLFTVLVAEGLSRVFVPISDLRENIALDGTRIRDYVQPGVVYRQVSNEYDALTTITDKGHRAPEVSGNPDVVFIGDSFTYGYGLADEETFVAIYCRERGLSCANLGLPGSGTLKQVERLEEFLARWQWRPRDVRLVFFAMSGSFSAGNDFVDNYHRELRMRQAAAGIAPAEGVTQPPQAGAAERLIGLQSLLLRHSNLLRLLKFYAGPMLKSMIVAEPGGERMDIALEGTRKALAQLDEMSRREGFTYQIYLIVPVQDILRGTHGQTLATLNGVAPKPAIPTAQVFADAPARYYFAFDGHLNPEGNRRLAEFLSSRDGAAGQ